MPEYVIIDTDPGIDDALAILLALQSPELRISAITTVSGNVPVEVATRNVFRILSLLPSAPQFPVAKGAASPLQKKPVYSTGFHGKDGLGGLDLAVFTTDFGRADCTGPSDCEGNFDMDADVDDFDLAVFVADFGRTDCP